MPLLAQQIRHTVFAVVDLETTGFNPETDRVVEIAVRRFNPADGSALTFDSLVDPERPMGGTQLHGIRAEHIQGAPTFRELAPTLRGLLSNAVLATYNVDFDARFLSAELQRVGLDAQLPQLCLMLLNPLLDLGPRCSLPDACRNLGVPFGTAWHSAAGDAEAAQGLLGRYLKECEARGLSTFGDLLGLGHHAFLHTLVRPLLPEQPVPECHCLSRREWPAEQRTLPAGAALKTYFDALVGILADARVTEEELNYLEDLQQRLHLTREQVGALHARAYLCVAMNYIGDDWLDATELTKLDHISRSLARLGWAPGAGHA